MEDMGGSLVAAVIASAAQQHGLISSAQLARLGVSRHHCRTMLSEGWLVKVAPRVFGIAGSPDSIERRQMSGLLCLGPTAAISHEAAARLHGFDRSRPDIVEFTMPRVGRGRKAPFLVHTTDGLGPPDVVTVNGFRCTSATRTIIDLARARIPMVRLEAAIDSAVRSGASSPVVIAGRLGELRGPGRWGAPALDELLLDTGGHSMLERRFLALMRTAGLPRPRTQVVHRDGVRTYARVDFYFDQLGIVVEVSGRRGHVSDAERARDAQRRNELQDVGRRVFEYTFADIARRPAFVVATMRTRLAAAG
jgi:very-short-patch-repair endonuclease